ncbi:MAG: TatD family hydrolase [Clostridiales bacterium]|nr:TatD family hydrolase [Clostridiales bacterium]
MIFDTHAHYDDRRFDEDREELLSGLFKSGIGRIVNVASGLPSIQTTLSLAKAYPEIYAAVGVHPEELSGLNEETIEQVRQAAACEKVVAIGEIGLDYYYLGDDEKKSPEQCKEEQKYWFGKQLELARDCHLPVIIHSREAAKDTYDLLEQHHAGEMGGVIHCYSYSKEMAQEYVKMGFYIGFGGVVTFSNAKKVREAAAAVPLERIVIETDCPYLAPVPNRGKRNSSANLPYVLETLAEIKECSVEELEEATWKNACDLYGLEE